MNVFIELLITIFIMFVVQATVATIVFNVHNTFKEQATDPT